MSNFAPSEGSARLPYKLESNQKYLGFKKVEVTKVDESKPWKPATEVKVTTANSDVAVIDANTPFFEFIDNDGVHLTVSAAAAGHIDDLHIKGTDAGSKFAYSSLEELFADVESKLPANVSKDPGVSAFSMEMGKSMGKEGIASQQELLAEGVISGEDLQVAETARQTVFDLNKSGDQLAKEQFVAKFKAENPASKIQFMVVRGAVVVPFVDAPKHPTTKLFMVFGPGSVPDTKTMYTAAPGRYMPKHPNPTQFSDAEMASGTFKESADAWFDTVMLTGVEKPVDPATVKAPVVAAREAVQESMDLQDPVKLLSSLLDDQTYRDNVVNLRTGKEREAVELLDKEAVDAANKRIKPLKEAAAMAAVGQTDLAAAQKLGKDWGKAMGGVKEVSIVNADGQTIVVSIAQALEQFVAEEKASRAERMSDLVTQLEAAKVREMQVIDTIKQDLLAKKDDPAFQEALAVWGNSPDASGGRGVDGKGFHAGVIHYFEYRANKEKAGRYNKEKDGAFGVQGFEEHSKALGSYLQKGVDLKSMPEVKGFARFTDENGRERLLLMTNEWTVSAFRWEGDSQLRVITVLPNGSDDSKGQNANRFQKMVTQEARHTSNDKGFLNHLGEQRNLVDADEATKSVLA